MRSIRNRVAIVGTAYSPVERRSQQTIGQLAVGACRAAIEDAGLAPDDVDGLASYPTAGTARSGPPVDGVDVVGVHYLAQAMGLENVRWMCMPQEGTLLSALVEAAHAVAAGACDHALVWRAMYNPPGAYGRVEQTRVSGVNQFTAPWGFQHNVIRFAMPYSRYMGLYGATREHLATFVVRNRANAAENPDAAFYGRPITRDDYLSTRMIAEPLSLLDCDMPVDAVGALVLTTAERARDLPQPPAYITGGATLGGPPRASLGLNLEDFMTSARRIARATWTSSGLSPADITHAHLYDGFSYFPYLFLEAFGFYGEGEAYLGLQDDTHARTGKLPLNTSGGALGMGRLHGTPQVIEAVRQIQGRAGARQIAHPDVALVQIGGALYQSGAMVLSGHP